MRREPEAGVGRRSRMAAGAGNALENPILLVSLQSGMYE